MNSSQAEQLKTVIGWIFAAGFTFLGLVFLAAGGFEFRQGLKSEDWPAAPGRIVESKVDASEPSGRDADYSVTVRYSYEVDGQKLEGDRLRYGYESHDHLTSAMEEQSLYPVGKEVKVYYDPTNLNRSVLIKGIGLSWMAMAFGLMALVLGLVAMVYIAMKRRAVTRVNMPASETVGAR